GTAVTGGSGSCEGGCGVVYKLTNSGGTWTQTVIHAFTGGDDGSGAGARVTLDRSGNVYGMAPTGGAYGVGTIYKIHQQHNGTWNLTVIHRSEEHTSELQSRGHLVCRLLLEKKKK